MEGYYESVIPEFDKKTTTFPVQSMIYATYFQEMCKTDTRMFTRHKNTPLFIENS